jgi:hypothetical protein
MSEKPFAVNCQNWQEDGSSCAEKRYRDVEKTSIHDLNKKPCQMTHLQRCYARCKKRSVGFLGFSGRTVAGVLPATPHVPAKNC